MANGLSVPSCSGKEAYSLLQSVGIDEALRELLRIGRARPYCSAPRMSAEFRVNFAGRLLKWLFTASKGNWNGKLKRGNMRDLKGCDFNSLKNN